MTRGVVPASIERVAETTMLERPDLRAHASADGTVAILFSDIENSTVRFAQLGDLRAQQLLRLHNSIISAHVAQHQGTVVKTMGDGFMVAFPSARRAVQCAVAIERAFDAHCAAHPEAALRVRIGIHLGEVIREAGDFFGRTVIVAARIGAKASGGEILVSSAVKEVTEGVGDLLYGAGRDVELKGLSGRYRVYAVQWGAGSPIRSAWPGWMRRPSPAALAAAAGAVAAAVALIVGLQLTRRIPGPARARASAIEPKRDTPLAATATPAATVGSKAPAEPAPHRVARAAGEPHAKSPRPAESLRAVPADGLTRVRAPSGGYHVAIPPGWIVKPIAGTHSIEVTPPADGATTVSFLLPIRISDAGYQSQLAACNRSFIQNPLFAPNAMTGCVLPAIRTQLADSSRRWSPRQALMQVLRMLASRGAVSFGEPTLTPVSKTEAFFEVPSSKAGGAALNWGHVVMAYLPNPILSQPGGAPGITSVAFISECSTPPAAAASFRSRCASMLGSFQPDHGFAAALAAEMLRTYAQEEQILLQMGHASVQNAAFRESAIADFGVAMQKMQLENFQTTSAAKYRMAQDWIATFAGRINLRDPETGKIYSLPYGYRSYCLDATGDHAIMGQDVTLGQWVGNPAESCARMLQP